MFMCLSWILQSLSHLHDHLCLPSSLQWHRPSTAACHKAENSSVLLQKLTRVCSWSLSWPDDAAMPSSCCEQINFAVLSSFTIVTIP